MDLTTFVHQTNHTCTTTPSTVTQHSPGVLEQDNTHLSHTTRIILVGCETHSVCAKIHETKTIESLRSVEVLPYEINRGKISTPLTPGSLMY